MKINKYCVVYWPHYDYETCSLTSFKTLEDAQDSIQKHLSYVLDCEVDWLKPKENVIENIELAFNCVGHPETTWWPYFAEDKSYWSDFANSDLRDYLESQITDRYWIIQLEEELDITVSTLVMSTEYGAEVLTYLDIENAKNRLLMEAVEGLDIVTESRLREHTEFNSYVNENIVRAVLNWNAIMGGEYMDEAFHNDAMTYDDRINDMYIKIQKVK